MLPRSPDEIEQEKERQEQEEKCGFGEEQGLGAKG
jgi:hypothetical protein